MNDRFRFRKPSSPCPRDHGSQTFEMNMKDMEVDTHLTKERRVYRMHVYRNFGGSRLAKLSLLAIHAAIFLAVYLVYQNTGHSKNSHQQQFSHHEPPKWTAHNWSLAESFASISSEEGQKIISNVCSDRKVVSSLQKNESAQTSDIPWTICMTINAGFYDFFQNWYYHFEMLNLKVDMVLFAEDPVAYDRLSSASFLNWDHTMVVNATSIPDPSHIYKKDLTAPPKEKSSASADESAEDSASSDEVFHAYSQQYRNLISNRPTRLLQVLCSGRNVLYIDTDTVLKKSPLPVIDKHYKRGVDISIAIDHVTRKKYAHGFGVCTGFVAIKANPKTVQFVSEWEKHCHLEESGEANNDQTAFNEAYQDFWLQRQESGTDLVKLHGLPVELFPNGQQFFKKYDEEQREKVVLVHANWIVGGENKRHSLEKHGLWDPSAVMR